MYSLVAFVAERTVFEKHFPSVQPAETIDLDHWPFALLPITGRMASRVRIECKIDLDQFGFTDDRYLENVRAIVARIVVSPSEATMAFIGSELHGGTGVTFGCAFKNSELNVFRDAGDKWPDTNISMALKEIGVPEYLDRRLDAFDVLGLGRHRNTEDWLASLREGAQ